MEKKNTAKVIDANIKNKIQDQSEADFETEKYKVKSDPVLTLNEQEELSQKALYLKYHDSFTGLNNRLYFTKALHNTDMLENLPLTVVLCDVNKLKLVNDSLGCHIGDKLLISFSNIFKRTCHHGDLLARIDNDEFAFIFLKTNEAKAIQKIESIKSQIYNLPMNTLHISVSFGHKSKTQPIEDINHIFKEATTLLNREKSTEKRDLVRKSVILILKAMFDKYQNEKEHSKRVSSICERMGKYLELTPLEIHKLKIAGAMHDIGKITIDEDVLYKKGKLTRREWNQIKNHSEAGYRILNSSSAFSGIAEAVYQHHEKWDGTGYPKRLKGKEILLNARVIAVVEAYDALTAVKTYRQQMSTEEAFAEILRCSGTQFDPEIVRVFIKFFKE